MSSIHRLFRITRLWYERVFMVVVVPLACHFLVSVREKDSFLDLIATLSYRVSFGYTLVVCYMAVYAISILSKRLDRIQPPLEFTVRVRRQMLSGFVWPLAGIVALASIYFGVFGLNIFNTGYFYHEMPLIIVFLLLINGFYFLLFIGFDLLRRGTGTPKIVIPVYYKQSKGIVNVKDVAFVNQVNKVNFLVLFNKELRVAEKTLDELSELFGADNYFKINRKQIVNRRAIVSFHPDVNGKLSLALRIDFKEPIYISKGRAAAFRKWLGYVKG